MADHDEFQELWRPLAAALRAEFSRGHEAGFAEGYQAALEAFVQTAQSLSPFPTPTDQPRSQLELAVVSAPRVYRAPADDHNLVVSRAPKGLLDDVLVKMLTESPGMTTQEAEIAAVERDSRIAVKSVYNRLRHFEKSGRKFRRVDGKWYRIEDIPAPFPVVRSWEEDYDGGAGKPPSQAELLARLGTRQGVPDNA